MLIGDAINVFRKGRSVANPALWKSIDATAAALAGLFASGLAIASALGYSVGIDDSAVQALATGVAGVLYLFHTGVSVVTTDKIGLPAKRGAEPGTPGESPEWRNPINPDGA